MKDGGQHPAMPLPKAPVRGDQAVFQSGLYEFVVMPRFSCCQAYTKFHL